MIYLQNFLLQRNMSVYSLLKFCYQEILIFIGVVGIKKESVIT